MQRQRATNDGKSSSEMRVLGGYGEGVVLVWAAGLESEDAIEKMGGGDDGAGRGRGREKGGCVPDGQARGEQGRMSHLSTRCLLRCKHGPNLGREWVKSGQKWMYVLLLSCVGP